MSGFQCRRELRLAASGTAIPFRHDLSFLAEPAVEQALKVTDGALAAKWLTPLPVAVRHGTAGAALDRRRCARSGAVVVVAGEAVTWATEMVAETTS
jgi:hypothetical protein